ncbi:hypothetical protein [Streptomyces sp. NPDC002619]|uniref:hypothetical protein n=1 Tax=Streptomyces sp. NPDC002619 TaxID=3364655 RepID=UPI0036AF076F
MTTSRAKLQFQGLLRDISQDCATKANLGGFSGAWLSDAYDDKQPLKAGTAFCVMTDKGNIVNAKVVRLIRNDSSHAPDVIEFTVTMWKPE